MEKEKKIDNNLAGNIPEFKPSLAFTDTVMGKISISDIPKKTFTYQPVIPKPVFYFLAIGIFCIILFSLFEGESEELIKFDFTSLVVQLHEILQIFNSPLLAISTLCTLVLLVFEKIMGRFVKV